MQTRNLVERSKTYVRSFVQRQGDISEPRNGGSAAVARKGLVAILISILMVAASQAQTFTVLHAFSNSTDGEDPTGLVMDASGNFYGTTGAGGSNLGGTLWKLTSAGTFSVLHAFSNATDGEDPKALMMDSSGNFYGTTGSGGANLGGTLWKRTSTGTFSVIHAFSNATDGENPGGLHLDTSGNFYGTTGTGGSNLGGTLWKVRRNL